MSGLLAYWPAPDQVEECLRIEAETADEALLLAVHQPVTLLRRSAQTSTEVQASEKELLAELMRPVKDGSAVVVAITGASGVGKSHMVRWLRAQLERHKRYKELVVITIPKTASLRRVVELILQPLHGSEYERLQRDLARTTDTLTPQSAAAHLATALSEELLPYGQRIADDVRAGRLSREMGPRVAVAAHVRNLTRDPAFLDHWFTKVLMRVVRSSLEGSSELHLRQFQAADFDVPIAISGKFEARDVKTALQYLANADGAYRATAAEVLQEVLDPALRSIFRFTETLQQRTVPEIVEDIRKQLLAEGKELVLLIEDLAALSGIQQPLLDIMIAEADHQGKRVRAPIRTAVAVTDGFLAGRQTVLTRAREQWVVQSEGMAEDVIVERLVDLTGRYLNAARFGLQQLRLEFKNTSHDARDLYAWVPRFDELLDLESDERLKAFGVTPSGIPLFPFNEFSIRSMAAQELKPGGTWTFNPRAYISQVLSKVLLQRERFEEGLFPSPGYKNPRISTKASQELMYLGVDDSTRGRLETTLYHWADNPASLQTAPPIDSKVFEAFGLTWPFSKTSVKPPTKLKGSSLKGEQVTQRAPQTDTPTPPPTEEMSAFGRAVEEWTESKRLLQTHAGRARALLAEALEQRIEMSDYVLHGQKVEARWFWLPPEETVSNPTERALRIHVVEPGAQVTPGIRAALQAMDRWEKNNKRWDYPSGEDDYAAANALLDSLENALLRVVLDEAERDAGILMATLHRQNLLLGISSSPKPELPSLRQLFAPAPEQAPVKIAELESPQRVAMETRDKSLVGRKDLQDKLGHYITCFQGSTGAKPLAANMDRLRKAWNRPEPSRWSLILDGRSGLQPSAVDVIERLSTPSLPALVDAIARAMIGIRPVILQSMSGTEDRDAWRTLMEDCIKEALRESIWPPDVRSGDVMQSVERLASVESLSTIAKVHKMEDDDPGKHSLERMAALCAVPLASVISLCLDMKLLQKILIEQEKIIGRQTRDGGDTALKQRDELLRSLSWEQ